MSSPQSVGRDRIVQAIDALEGAYEFMLAYAAQGRRADEDTSGTGVRESLQKAADAMQVLASATLADIGASGAHVADFLSVVNADAAKANAAVVFVLSQKGISSQIVDNLNASIHVRTLLTDIFLLDEGLKISGL